MGRNWVLHGLSCWGLALLVACATGKPRERLAPSAEIAASPSDDDAAIGAESGRVLLASMPSPPGSLAASPLSMGKLVVLARSQGIGIWGPQVAQNREIGRAFQLAVSRSISVAENVRRFPTFARRRAATVVPDGVLFAMRVQTLPSGLRSLDAGGFLEVVGPELEDVFLEIKARGGGSITPSTAQGQMLGFIDALARRRQRSTIFGSGSARPGLLLVTTSDTKISPKLALEAGKHGVALFHSVALEADGLVTVGTFKQETGFSDVIPLFVLPSTPTPLVP